MVDVAKPPEDLADEYADDESMPDGTVARRPLSSAEARALFDEDARDLQDVGGVDLSAPFNDALGLGDPERPTELFTRMYFATEEEAKEWAWNTALNARFLKNDPFWQKEAWVHMSSPDMRFRYLLGIAYRCVDFRAMRVAVMNQTGVLAPSLFEMAVGKMKRLFYRRRKNQATSEDPTR